LNTFSGRRLTVIALTPGLNIHSSTSLTPYTKPRRNAPKRAGQSGLIATKEMLLQSSQHVSIDYTGREEDAGRTDSLLKHYVGVLDPKTGKLRVIEARKMTIRGVVRAQEAAPEAMLQKDHIQVCTDLEYPDVTTNNLQNMRELRNDLGQTFGTKKSKKAIASLTENAITKNRAPDGIPVEIDSATSTMLAHMSEATAGMATRDQLQAAVDEAKPRPKANINAENVNDVYTVEELIGSEVMKLIPVKEWQDLVKKKQDVFVDFNYVAKRIELSSSNVQKLKVLRYLCCVLMFFRATSPRRGVRVLPQKNALREALSDVPEAVLGNIQRKFSSHGEMSKFQQDLLITNVCALALVVDNFEVDMSDLLKDLQLDQKQLNTYFSEIGARITPATESERKMLGVDKAAARKHYFARLKLPLAFPKAKFARK
jgi:DNA-directed RNA polymerase I subunit RPA49